MTTVTLRRCVVRTVADIFRSYAEIVNGRHVNGTDKQSNHAYGDAYESFVDRKSTELVLEVGVADGSSLLAWSEVFPNAHIVGMDIHPASKWRGEFHLGDQRSAADCARAVSGRQFDLIVEDATHQLADTLTTLFLLWPAVRPGGLYVVEEFPNIGEFRSNLVALFPTADIVDTRGPFGGVEPLVVLRKPI